MKNVWVIKHALLDMTKTLEEALKDTEFTGLLLSVAFLILTDLCQLFSDSLFACILFPGFRGMHVCQQKWLCFCFFVPVSMILLQRQPKRWIKVGICLNFKANHYQFWLLSLKDNYIYIYFYHDLFLPSPAVEVTLHRM